MRALLILLFFILHGGSDEETKSRVEVFSWHRNRPVVLYHDKDLRSKSMLLYPFYEEDPSGDVGFIFHIVDLRNEDTKSLCIEIGNDIYYAKKGTFAVNTRNYNHTPFYLYDSPKEDAVQTYVSSEEQTVTIFGISGDWLYVQAKTDKGKLIYGWLPPEMQCGNPFTTCG